MSDLINRLYARLACAMAREDGQAVTEYAVVLVVIAAVAGLLVQQGVAATITGKITTQLGKI
jgi:hypothetical protein